MKERECTYRRGAAEDRFLPDFVILRHVALSTQHVSQELLATDGAGSAGHEEVRLLAYFVQLPGRLGARVDFMREEGLYGGPDGRLRLQAARRSPPRCL